MSDDKPMRTIRRAAIAALAATLCAGAAAQTDNEIETVVVTPSGRWESVDTAAPQIAQVALDDAASVAHLHPAELRLGLPGVWISRGSGQEHLTAIRSPVLTGAGSCGGFLVLEHGLPVRPAGFCNVNGLMEVNLEQAAALEVLRGPGPVLYGSGALHGVYRAIADSGARALRLDSGPADFWRLSAVGDHALADGKLDIRAFAAHDGGQRAASGYGQGKLNVDYDGDLGDLRLSVHFAAALLNQETAGFIRGLDAYRDAEIAASNPNPEAYRDVDAQRFSMRIETPGGHVVHPYLRRSGMDFLQHFLPGQPREENGHRSSGLAYRFYGHNLLVGADVDVARVQLKETQARPLTGGSDFLAATRPAGKHYDFEVDALNVAAYARKDWQRDAWSLSAGLRVEHAVYEYDNRMLTGNTDAQGVPCDFGGCIFSRPADRRDRFTNAAPKLEAAFEWSPQLRLFATAARGFRAPQVTELYRLQRDQIVADLDSETLDSLEAGVRAGGTSWRLAASAFVMRKDEVILRDADGFNVSDGRTSHRGVEVDLDWLPGSNLTASLSATVARHRYEFSRNAGGGEIITRGNDVDTAPRLFGNAALRWRYRERASLALEWEHMGPYYTDAANDHRYSGHDLLHFGGSLDLSKSWRLGIRVRNVFDRAYAERADFAFGSHRYFPGVPRSLYVSVAWQGDGSGAR